MNTKLRSQHLREILKRWRRTWMSKKILIVQTSREPRKSSDLQVQFVIKSLKDVRKTSRMRREMEKMLSRICKSNAIRMQKNKIEFTKRKSGS